MKLHNRVRSLSAVLAASALLAFSSPAFSQDVSDSHMKAARAAVAALHATDVFDNILPQAAAALEQQLIQKNPDMAQTISSTIDEKTLGLASRRADLEKEAAVAYAQAFSEQELNDIATFYSSPSGQKLLNTGPIAMRKLVDAADIWQNGIARDLAQQVGDALNAETKTQAQPAPADATQPAAPKN